MTNNNIQSGKHTVTAGKGPLPMRVQHNRRPEESGRSDSESDSSIEHPSQGSENNRHVDVRGRRSRQHLSKSKAKKVTISKIVKKNTGIEANRSTQVGKNRHGNTSGSSKKQRAAATDRKRTNLTKPQNKNVEAKMTSPLDPSKLRASASDNDEDDLSSIEERRVEGHSRNEEVPSLIAVKQRATVLNSISSAVIKTNRQAAAPSNNKLSLPCKRPRNEIVATEENEGMQVQKVNKSMEKEFSVVNILMKMESLSNMMVKLDERLKKMETQTLKIVDQLEGETSSMKGSESVSAASIKVNKGGTKKLDMYETLMGGRLVLLNEHFTSYSFARSTVKVVCLKLITLSTRGMYGVHELRKALGSLMFSRSGNASKKMNDEDEEGALICAVKRNIVLDCLSNAQKNFDKLYADEEDDYTRPRRPFWLRKSSKGTYYLCESGLQTGFNRREKCSTEHKSLKRRIQIGDEKITPNCIDDAEYVSFRSYGELTKHFNNSRRWSITMLCESLFYLFYDWKFESKEKDIGPVSLEEDKETLSLKWVGPRLSKPLSLRDIPKTSCTAAAVDENVEKFTNFIRERTDVQLIVTHVAYVSKKAGTVIRKRRGTVKKTWKRVISFLDMAALFLHSYSGLDKNSNVHEVLQYSEYSIITCYLLALGLRDFVEKQEVVKVEASSELQEPRRPPYESDINCCQEILTIVKPNQQQMGRSLKANVSCVPLYEYDMYNADKFENDDEEAGAVDETRDEQVDGGNENELHELTNAAASLIDVNEERIVEKVDELCDGTPSIADDIVDDVHEVQNEKANDGGVCDVDEGNNNPYAEYSEDEPGETMSARMDE